MRAWLKAVWARLHRRRPRTLEQRIRRIRKSILSPREQAAYTAWVHEKQSHRDERREELIEMTARRRMESAGIGNNPFALAREVAELSRLYRKYQ